MITSPETPATLRFLSRKVECVLGVDHHERDELWSFGDSELDN